MVGKPAGESPDFPDVMARLPKGRHGLPPEFVARNQRERLIASFIALLEEDGFDKVTITALVEGAGVSSVTFYKHFETLEDCYAAAFDQTVADLGRVLAEAHGSQSEWPLQVRAVLAAWLEYLAEDPPLARLLTAEPFVAGPAIASRYKAAIERAVPYLRAGRELRPGAADSLPPSTERGLLGAVNGLISRQVKAGRAASLPALLPDLTQFALTPYLGAAEAQRVAARP